MKLFISYSRDDKAWVYELFRALRDKARHDPWIDLDIKGGANWWETILEEIEAAECVLYVMTPKSVDSIYCRAEVDYALALKKPIIPLMLKTAAFPAELAAQHIQYDTMTDQTTLSDLLLIISNNLLRVMYDRSSGKYIAPNPAPLRPGLPKPIPGNPEHVFEVFALAEESAAEGNLAKAEALFQQVMAADPQGLGLAAAERLAEIKWEHDRAIAYQQIIRMAANPVLLKGTQAAWRSFTAKYGADYDPQGIMNKPPAQPTPAPAAPPKPKTLTTSETAAAIRAIIGDPFDLCDVPAGEFLYGEKKQKLTLPAFSIAKYPITYSQFQPFIDAKDGFYENRWWEGLAANADQRAKPGDQNWKTANYPRERVSWYEAMAFCRWLSFKLGGGYNISQINRWTVRLPTEFEWEKAARGTDGREYPYGNTFDKLKANTEESGIGKTTPVTQYPQGASPYEVLDMSGNVWEWCLTDYDNPALESVKETIRTEVRRVLRGGSWFNGQDGARSVVRSYSHLVVRNLIFGFRLLCRPHLP